MLCLRYSLQSYLTALLHHFHVIETLSWAYCPASSLSGSTVSLQRFRLLLLALHEAVFPAGMAEKSRSPFPSQAHTYRTEPHFSHSTQRILRFHTSFPQLASSLDRGLKAKFYYSLTPSVHAKSKCVIPEKKKVLALTPGLVV